MINRLCCPKILLIFLGVVFLNYTNHTDLAFAADGDNAQSGLTEEQKIEKRLLFSRYVEDELARKEKEKYEKQKEEPKKMWITGYSLSAGSDSNIYSSPTRNSDMFLQQSLTGSLKFDRPAIPLLPGHGKIGVNGYTNFLNYYRHESLSYDNSTASIFTEEKLNERLFLKIEYDFGYLRYPKSKDVTYYSHRVKPALTYYSSPTLSHTVFISGELKDFKTRRAVSGDNQQMSKRRRDGYYETGYSLGYYPRESTYLFVTGLWKTNDSNDLYRDLNDYQGWNVNGYIYQKLIAPFSLLGFAGYDSKTYKSKIFQAGSTETERDSFYYLGGYLYYDINKSFQLFASYLYRQNNSNDASVESNGYTWTGGTNITF